MPIRFLLDLPKDRREALTQRLIAHTTLEKVTRGGVNIEDVLPQDEFTHDALAPYEDLWLVYDCT